MAGLVYLRKLACVNGRAGALNPPPRANAFRGKVIEKATGKAQGLHLLGTLTRKAKEKATDTATGLHLLGLLLGTPTRKRAMAISLPPCH